MRDEPELPAASPDDMPDWLINAFAVETFRKHAKTLADLGVFGRGEVEALAVYANTLARMVMKWNAGGEPTAAELTQYRLLATEFGFTPATRSKIGGGNKRPANSFAGLKSG